MRRRRPQESHKPRTFSRWEYDAAPKTFSKKSCSLRAARPLEKALQWPNSAPGTHRSARSRAAAPVPQPSDPAGPFLQTRPSLQRLRPRWRHTRLPQQSRHSLVRTRFFPRAGSDLISRLARVRARRRQSPESSFEIRHPLRRLFRTIDGPFERVNFSPLHPVCGILRAASPGKRSKAQARQGPRCVYQLAIACSKDQLPRAILLSTLGKVRPLYFSRRGSRLMLIPLRHENMEGRRWPVVTFAVIALNILVFLCTHWKMEEQAPERAEVRMHVIILAGIHPELKKTENVQEFVNEVQNKVPEQFWKQLSSPNRKIEDSWDARIRLMEDPELLQAEMDGLAARFTEEEKSSILGNYAFVPAHPRPITYLTSMFLHTGWLHLLGNMWFLWLAGFILEDTWGRVIYPVFYLIAGAAALQFHAWFYPGSIVPALGASGAVAALMGGFLVRFPKMKIHMLWFMLIFRKNEHEPQHVDFHFGEAHEKPTHQSGHRTGSPESRDDASRVEPGVKLRCGRPREQVEDRINHATPFILENEACEPQEPHIADQMKPTGMKKHRG